MHAGALLVEVVVVAVRVLHVGALGVVVPCGPVDQLGQDGVDVGRITPHEPLDFELVHAGVTVEPRCSPAADLGDSSEIPSHQ